MAALVMLSAALLLGLLQPSSMADNVLYAGNRLNTSQSLTEGNYTFIMQPDCNLGLYHNGEEVWSSDTSGRGNNCFALLQADGNLVIINDQIEVVWSSNTAGAEDDRYILILHPDGPVIIYKPTWTRPRNNGTNYKGVVIVKRGHSDTSITAVDNNILYDSNRLNTSQSLTEGNYTFIMQPDCNLVLYHNGEEAWSSDTSRRGNNCFALLQADGNHVIINDQIEVVWSSNTAGAEDDRYIIVLQPDGYVMIYEPIWTRPINTANSTNRKITMVTKN